jgi:putative acetyltransferase
LTEEHIWIVREDDPLQEDVRALIEMHLSYAHAHTPAEHVFALPANSLVEETITFYSVRKRGKALGIAALRELDERTGELKSMHTSAEHRCRGIGRALLSAVVDECRRRGYEELKLETGTMKAFAPARRLYTQAGFAECEPFAQYTLNPHSVCMSLDLGHQPPSQGPL